MKFQSQEWLTERSYSGNFAEIPRGPGVYALVRVTLSDRIINHQVLYIGQSKNIKARLRSHDILRKLIKTYGLGDIFVYFVPVTKKLRKAERKFIRQFNPPYNLQHRIRGFNDEA